jgi:hypothetical protein
MPKALIIRVEGPLTVIELALGDRSQLRGLQELVGGLIEAIPLPPFIDPAGRMTAYVNETGKFDCEPNMRATDFMIPGVGIAWGDYVAGPLVIMGFDPERGVNTDVPKAAIERATLIAAEAGGGYDPVVVDGVKVAESRHVQL